MSYLKANIFWKNIMRNTLTKAGTFRRVKEIKNKRSVKSEKFVFLKLTGLLLTIVAAAVLFVWFAAWWSGI